MTNPFGVGASFDLTIDGATFAPINRSDVIGPEVFVRGPRLDFTGQELRSFLRAPDALLTGNATVDPAPRA